MDDLFSPGKKYESSSVHLHVHHGVTRQIDLTRVVKKKKKKKNGDLFSTKKKKKTSEEETRRTETDRDRRRYEEELFLICAFLCVNKRQQLQCDARKGYLPDYTVWISLLGLSTFLFSSRPLPLLLPLSVFSPFVSLLLSCT